MDSVRSQFRDMYHYSLSDVDLNVHMDDELEDDEYQELPKVLPQLKCLFRNCAKKLEFKVFDATTVSELLLKCYRTKPDVWIRETDVAVWTYGLSPVCFYMKWRKNLDQSRFLRLWLTDTARANLLKPVTSVVENRLYVAEFDADKCWYRAKVTKCLGNGVYQCLFVDYGISERCYVDQLRRLPVPLEKVPKYAFQCKLDFSVGAKVTQSTLLKFVTKLKSTKKWMCRLSRMSRFSEGFDVDLWDEEKRNIRNLFPPASEYEAFEDEGLITELVEEAELDHRPSLDEEKYMHHPTAELRIPSRDEIPSMGYDCYSIEEAIAPDEIYVRNFDNPDDQIIKKLRDDMKKDYGGVYEDSYKIATPRVYPKRPYAWYNKFSEHWERVIVIRTDLPVGNVLVQRIDYGQNVLVNVEDMLELIPKFCDTPPWVDLAHLVHIKPRNGEHRWSREACTTLHELIRLQKIFFGVLLSRTNSSHNAAVRGGTPRVWDSAGLLLVYADVNHEYPYSLQSLLVSLGCAEGAGIGAGHPFVPYLNIGVPRVTMPAKNSKKTASKEVKSWTKKQKLKFPTLVKGSEDLLCRLGERKRSQEESLEGEFPMDIKNCVGWMDVVHLNGPGHIYIHMKLLDLDFYKMTDLLLRTLQPDPISLDKLQEGEIVAVYYVHDRWGEFIPCWNRAFILKSYPDRKMTKVIFIDYGYVTFIPFDHVKSLPSELFQPLPFCRRVHLSIPDLKPCGKGNWPADAVCNFNQYISTWSGRNTTYFTFQKDTSETPVSLDFYDQELRYLADDKTWIKDVHGRPASPEFEALNTNKDRGLLRHFFQSVPVQIYYEHKSNYTGLTSTFYRFRPVWDILIDNGYLMKSTT